MRFEGVRGFFRDRPIFAGNLIASAGTMLTLFLAYLFHFVMTRIMPQSEYGDLSVLIGVFAVATVPAASISAALARELSGLEARGEALKMNYVLDRYMKYGFALSLLAFAAISAGALFVYKSRALQVAAAAIAVSVPASYYVNLATSYFQAKERIFTLMAIGVAKEALRLAVAVGLVLAGWGIVGGAASYPAAYFALAAVLALYFSGKTAGKEKHRAVNLKRSVVLMMSASLVMSAMMYADLFFVKALIGSVQAGSYNVASTTAKLVFYLSAGIGLVVLPKSAKLSYAEDGEKILQIIVKSCAFLVPATLVLIVFASPIVALFFPAQYAPAVAPLGVLAVGMFFFAVESILINIMWSQRQEGFPLAALSAGLAVHALLLSQLVPRMQLMGAALATVASSVLLLSASAAYVWRSVAAARSRQHANSN